MRDRSPPSDEQLERIVLATALLVPGCVAELCALLTAEHFFCQAHRVIWDGIVSLHARAQHVDSHTLIGALDLAGKLALVGGTSRVLDLTDGIPDPKHAIENAQQLIKLAHARDLMTAGLEVHRSGLSPIEDIDGWIDSQHAKLAVTMQARASALAARELCTVSAEVLENLLNLRDSGEQPAVLSTGYAAIDNMSGGGMRAGELWIVGGRPGMAKSALALNVCLRSAAASLVLSLEMPSAQWAERSLACLSGLALSRIRSGKFLDVSIRELASAQQKLEAMSVLVLDALNLTVGQLTTIARTTRSRAGGLGIVVVDYLQLMRGANKRERREQEVAEISRGLKAMAMELGVTVIALSQLNRLSENRPDRRPQLGDLRESGAVEQDADVVLLLHRDESLKDTDRAGETEVIFAKQRNGETGKVRLNFVGDLVRLEGDGST
jgi:replicative DNA helicase